MEDATKATAKNMYGIQRILNMTSRNGRGYQHLRPILRSTITPQQTMFPRMKRRWIAGSVSKEETSVYPSASMFPMRQWLQVAGR